MHVIILIVLLVTSGFILFIYFFIYNHLATNGVVLATENKHKSILYEEQAIHKVEPITDHIGMVYSGKIFIAFKLYINPIS